ncbi:hypothetical protein ACOMHN_039135 [Nucella lapillus]
MTKFSPRTLTSCVPICRSDLFEEVTQRDPTHPVSRVWMSPGHVFVSVENGHKLLTFDCKPVMQQHSISSGTLDFPALKPAILDIVISPLSSNIAYIVQRNGRVHCWQFSSTYQWSPVSEFDLCEVAGSEVTSVSLHPKRHALYWCERQPGQESLCRICSKALPQGGEEMTKQGQRREVVVQDCPAAGLLPLDYGLLIVPRNRLTVCRYRADQTRVSIFWQPSVLQMVSVVTIVGDRVRDHYDMRSPLVFSNVLINTLSDLSLASPQGADLGAKQDITTGRCVLLRLDGTLQSFGVIESHLRQSIAVHCVRIAMPESVLHTADPADAWSIHREVVAIATSLHTVRLYGATQGHLLHDLKLDLGACVQRLVQVRSPAVLVAMATSSGVIVVQGGKRITMPGKEQGLPGNKHFQTDALQVALLAQQREEKAGSQVSEQLASLHRRWISLQDQQPRSPLSDTVDGYLSEFWRLEEVASRLGKSQSCAVTTVYDARAMVRDAVSRSRAMTSDTAVAELTWLSQKYPQYLLAVLIGHLQVDKEKLTSEDHALWQRTLGMDSSGGQGHSALTFELLCRLLYHQTPHALVSFVRNVQTVSEQSVGVMAFVRRKHMLQYYVRAMECLPEPGLSTSPQTAAIAKAQIILKGATDQGPERALRFLLRHSCWPQAMALLRGLGPSLPHHASLFSLLLQHLLQAQALSDYASEVFSLLPTWKSFLPALKLMGENHGSPSSPPPPPPHCPPGLFCGGAPDIPLSALRPALMDRLHAQR